MAGKQQKAIFSHSWHYARNNGLGQEFSYQIVSFAVTESRKYIRTCRKKTDVEAFIPLHPIAEQILSLYNTTDDSKPIFPLPCRDMIWFEIHELGFAHQFKRNLSYHQSRHTFGTLLVSAGVPMESIAKMMGHTNIRTTQGYAKVTDDKISEDMDRLIVRRSMV